MSKNVLEPSLFNELFAAEGASIGLQIKELLHKEQSTYQNIEIYDTTHFGHLMVLDGCIMLTQRENFIYHEMMSHPALFSHPSPQKVIIIGGGDCGTLQEVLKHPEVETALQVELDPRVTELSEQFFPELCQNNNDPRADFYFGDGIQWVKNAEAHSIDIIIIDSTDPVGPAEGLFSTEFYRNCHRALKANGILVQQSESPLFHSDSIINKMQSDLCKSGFNDTLVRTFPQPVYPSGWWSCTLGFKQKETSIQAQTPLRPFNFETRYYTEELHSASTKLPAFMLSKR